MFAGPIGRAMSRSKNRDSNCAASSARAEAQKTGDKQTMHKAAIRFITERQDQKEGCWIVWQGL
jgi:hypothetical protein